MKVVLIGIAGTSKDFLLSLPALKCFLYQDNYINDNVDIILKQYYYISPECIKERSKKILNDIKKENPDIVGFSCYVWNIEAIKIISDKLKKEYEDILVLLGGPEIAKEDIINGKFDDFKVDFLIFGEGEKPFLFLLKSIIASDEEQFRKIKGFAYRTSDTFFCSGEPDFIENIHNLPSPYFEGYVSDGLLSRPDIRASIETQRGCSFRCAYCFYHKNFPKIRYRDENMVIDEINYVHKKGIKAARILDANFLSDKDFAKKIIRGIIKYKIKMSLFIEALPQFVDEEISHLFGQYINISFENRITFGMGIQTLNEDSLKIIRRTIPLGYFENAFSLLQRQGVIIKTDVILGFPRETKETYFKIIEYVAEKMRYGTNVLSLALLRILPGSDMMEIANREGLKIDGRGNSQFVYSTPDLCRMDMLECLRINAAASRLLCPFDIKNRLKLRDIYFEVKDHLKVTNIQLLKYFADRFSEFLKDKDINYVKNDFPNAEDYYTRNIYNDIPDEWLIQKLKELKIKGIIVPAEEIF